MAPSAIATTDTEPVAVNGPVHVAKSSTSHVGSTKKKTPFYLRAPAGESMAFAGIYSWWKDHSLADDDPDVWTLTTTILTADSVRTLDHIHDRNPVPLPRDLWDDWLDPRIEGTQDFVDAAVAAAIPVAESLDVIELAAVTDDEPVALG